MRKRSERRSFSDGFKKTVVAQTYEAGASVPAVAKRHDVTAAVVRRWRNDPRYAQDAERFLPVEIDSGPECGAASNNDQAELSVWIAE